MALIGYQRKSERKNGGIRTVGLTEASNIASIEYSKDDRAFFEITLVNGQKFTKYEFREDEAEYKETISLSNHSPIVTHELTFMLDKMGYEASASVESMLNTTLGGLVALVRTTNDEIFLVGYSLPFEKERPLRIASVTATTGKQLRDETTDTITLRSIDTNMALPFVGDIDALF